jgi:hypothetical protein
MRLARFDGKVVSSPELRARRMTTGVEPFLTLKQASAAIGIPYFKLQRAAANGTIPTYRFFNQRLLVRLSEVISAVEASRRGGNQ